MKTLSIRQPWAELILQGRKTIGLRTWTTHYRGRILLHAGRSVELDACKAHGIDPREVVRGALVGTVEISDMVDFDADSFAALRDQHLYLGDWPGDLVGWRLSNPQRLEAPIPMRGRLGLFEVPEDILQAGTVPDYLSPPQPSPVQPEDYNPDTPFELRVEPRDAGSYALAIYQWPVKANGSPFEPKRVVVLSGTNLQAVADHVLQALRHGGYKVTDLSPRRRKPFRLDEETGLRLGLLFLTVAPLSRLDRIEAISHQLRTMPSEEAYYWYSKCTDPHVSNRAQQALRVLLSAE